MSEASEELLWEPNSAGGGHGSPAKRTAAGPPSAPEGTATLAMILVVATRAEAKWKESKEKSVQGARVKHDEAK